MILLQKIPLPPSENNAYPTVRNKRTGKLIRVPSKNLNQFKLAFDSWRFCNLKALTALKTILKQELHPRLLVYMELDFYVNEQTLFTLKGERKRWDITNRIKPLCDALANALEIDDRYFTVKTILKTVSEKEPFINVHISFDRIKELAA